MYYCFFPGDYRISTYVLIPNHFKSEKKNKKSGKAGIFAGSLELVKEGNLKIKQEKLFDDVYIKEN